MTPQEFAALLNGREYGEEITREEEALAKAHGLVVVFGYSDDNMEFCGAITDEVGCYDGRHAYVNKDGLSNSGKKITAVWDTDGYSWIYQTDIPHATFEIVEGDDPYCRGIVFALADVG